MNQNFKNVYDYLLNYKEEKHAIQQQPIIKQQPVTKQLPNMKPQPIKHQQEFWTYNGHQNHNMMADSMQINERQQIDLGDNPFDMLAVSKKLDQSENFSFDEVHSTIGKQQNMVPSFSPKSISSFASNDQNNLLHLLKSKASDSNTEYMIKIKAKGPLSEEIISFLKLIGEIEIERLNDNNHHNISNFASSEIETSSIARDSLPRQIEDQRNTSYSYSVLQPIQQISQQRPLQVKETIQQNQNKMRANYPPRKPNTSNFIKRK